jgi:hypothetical protein
VFGGGGARCFGYAGALHALRQLGLMGRLKGVSGSSGGAVYALLAALRFRCARLLAHGFLKMEDVAVLRSPLAGFCTACLHTLSVRSGAVDPEPGHGPSIVHMLELLFLYAATATLGCSCVAW